MVPLQPDDSITQITGNNAKNPLFITISSAPNAVEELVVSMSYGTANMPFISEATGVEDYEQVWENIPVDHSINLLNFSRRTVLCLNLVRKQAGEL